MNDTKQTTKPSSDIDQPQPLTTQSPVGEDSDPVASVVLWPKKKQPDTEG